jgi:hypothetical protein
VTGVTRTSIGVHSNAGTFQSWTTISSRGYTRSEINKLITLLGIRKTCHSSGRNLLLYLFIKRVIRMTIVIIEEFHCYQLHTKFYPIFFLKAIHM